MQIRLLQTPAELSEYDTFVRTHEHGSLWQSLAWKTYQESLGREVRIYAAESQDSGYDATALVVIDTTIGGMSTWEIPRGPLSSDARRYSDLVAELHAIAKASRCFAMYVSPMSRISLAHARQSDRHIQPEATRIVDISVAEEVILAQMHPKGRYNIGVAKKHGVTITEGTENDLDAFYELLQGTGGRDGFQISQKSHYARFLASLEGSFMLLAYHAGMPIAGLMGVQWGQTTIYYYGASSYEHRHLMAPYLLQWEAMRRTKARGAQHYDLLGISHDQASPDDPWWGITDFKRKFGGMVVSYPPEQMIVLKPALKMALDLKRRILG